MDLNQKWINCVSFNCQSLRNKTQKILEYLIANKIHLAMLQETWLKTTDITIFSEITEYNFKSLKKLKIKERWRWIACFLFLAMVDKEQAI